MKMPEERPYVIFLTAHPEHAVQAFDVGAVDYLLKPVDEPRLAKAIARARHAIDHGEVASHGAQPLPQKIAIASRGGVSLVSPSDITHATFDGALVTIHTAARSVLTDDSLQDLEAKLPHGPFERVHRRAIVNLDHVDRLESASSGGYVAYLSTGKQVDVSRQSPRRLRRRLGLR